MARILIKKEWFDELSPTALYETDFENIVINQATSIFPDFFVIPFKTRVYTDDDLVIPDLAIIDKSYRDWWVVEVEMNYHSFDDHILPQVFKLSIGNYGRDQASFICSKMKTLNKEKIYQMMKGKQPQVLVIVNKPMPDWVHILSRYNAKVCVVEVFRSNKNQYIFRVNGEYPIVSSNHLTDCHFDPLIPRFMVVQSPASIPTLPGEKLKLRYENCMTEWERIDGHDKVWLSPIGLNPLSKKKMYTIYCQGDGSFTIIEKE